MVSGFLINDDYLFHSHLLPLFFLPRILGLAKVKTLSMLIKYIENIIKIENTMNLHKMYSHVV
jgi:hypothetical protein